MKHSPISIIGMPMDLGQGRRGVDMGPSAIRYASLKQILEHLELDVEDLGNIDVPEAESVSVGKDHLKYLEPVADCNEELARKVLETLKRKRFPLVLGGDHSIAIGTLAGVTSVYRNIGLIWYDAHGDLNTSDTSPSGNIHGMPLAASLGIGHPRLVNVLGFSPKVSPEKTVLVGVRDLDPGERELIHKLGIKAFTMHEIDRLGMARVMEEVISIVTDGTDGVHLSLDLDALDPLYCPGVGTPVPGGVTYRETHLALEMLAETNTVISAEFVEVNPILDRENRTAEVAVSLISSLFGKKIL